MAEVASARYAAENKGSWILATCWVVTAISTLFVLARVYVRGFVQKKFQQDDVWVIIAQICSYISTALSTVAVHSGNGQHWSLLSADQQQRVILWTTAAFCPGVVSFGLPKLAVIYLLTKLLNPSRLHKMFLWWMGIWCQLTLFATVGILLGKCTPARSLWDFSVKGKCIDNNILVSYCIYAGGQFLFPFFLISLVTLTGVRTQELIMVPQHSRHLSTFTWRFIRQSFYTVCNCPSRRKLLFVSRSASAWCMAPTY